MECLVFLCAKCVAERVAEDGVGFDLGGTWWWGGIGIFWGHVLSSQYSSRYNVRNCVEFLRRQFSDKD